MLFNTSFTKEKMKQKQKNKEGAKKNEKRIKVKWVLFKLFNSP